VIAPSYADIFYNNSFKNGILLVTLSDAQVDDLFERLERQEGYRLTADLEKQIITDESGLKIPFEIDPFRKNSLLKGLDDIGLTLEHETDITAFEKSHPVTAVMYDPVDVKLSQPA
jgi:3-isopropylmalate/(R)-2-methylmalate dehydratase small subunit